MEFTHASSITYSGSQINEAYYEMLLKLTEEMSVKQVVEYISQTLHLPVILYTRNGSHIFTSGKKPYLRETLTFLQAQFSSPENLQLFFDKKRTSHEKTSYENVYFDTYDAVVYPYAISADLLENKENIGTLCFFDIDKDDFSSEAETLHLFCKILSAKLYSSYVLQPLPQMPSDSYTFLDVNNGAKWLRKIKGDQFQNFYIAVSYISNLSDEELERLKYWIDQSGLLFRMIMHKPNIIILFNVHDNDEAAVLRDVLKQVCAKYSLPIGLSYKFRSTKNIRNSYTQALRALSVGNFLSLGNQLCEFEHLSVNSFLYELMHTADLTCYRNGALDTLWDLDQKNCTEYYDTLKAFISSGGSKVKTTQTLLLHRNTLTYRLERIEEILKLNLDDLEVQTKLWLDIKIKEILDVALKENY